MHILGIETSGLQGSVSLARDGICLTEIYLNQAGRRHAQSLILEIGEILRANGLTPRQIDLVAVSRGPGSFTGLRVGMTCAKTFAYSTGCRFIAIDTFAAIVENVPGDVNQVQIIEDAQRDELFAAEYCRNAAGNWEPASVVQIISVAEFLAKQSSIDAIAGPGVKKLKSVDCPAKIFAQPEICQPKASVIARLGWQWSQSEQSNATPDRNDFWKALPFYLRQSAAEEKHSSSGVGRVPG